MPTRTFFIVTALALAASAPAQADGHRRLPADTPATYLQECGACHAPYPPRLLPAASWQRVMAGLERHYGTHAALDAATTASLEAWLRSHAATGRRAAEPPQDRITRTAWFDREHRGIDPAAWRLDSVRSAANCGACHTGADQGDYDDDSLRLPAGLERRRHADPHD